jgi:hypothetical protein
VSESTRTTIALPPDFAGWFAWEHGPRGPAPVKISKERVPYLTRDEWNKKTVKSWPLTVAEFELTLEELAKKYPLS